MFNFFRRTSPIDKMYKQHEQLLQEAFSLSKSNRTQSDAKYAAAEELLNQIKKTEAQQ
ncbi:MAG: Lacal_2735 family protein [Flammeovirgaceae bacterium]|jgi:hypothetical protein|nr:Lacal_2735 family protein [Flammeovirgaceae bacterium]|tara:strand:- start:39247 stop:39420 length:174 start_codon:yes stop_codon:yes gene_type:complete